jgi:hypothetical protein
VTPVVKATALHDLPTPPAIYRSTGWLPVMGLEASRVTSPSPFQVRFPRPELWVRNGFGTLLSGASLPPPIKNILFCNAGGGT